MSAVMGDLAESLVALRSALHRVVKASEQEPVPDRLRPRDRAVAVDDAMREWLSLDSARDREPYPDALAGMLDGELADLSERLDAALRDVEPDDVFDDVEWLDEEQ